MILQNFQQRRTTAEASNRILCVLSHRGHGCKQEQSQITCDIAQVQFQHSGGKGRIVRSLRPSSARERVYESQMPLQLKTYTGLPEDQNSVSSNHVRSLTTTCNSNSRPLRAPDSCTQTTYNKPFKQTVNCIHYTVNVLPFYAMYCGHEVYIEYFLSLRLKCLKGDGYTLPTASGGSVHHGVGE